jgi:hypothetical protein
MNAKANAIAGDSLARERRRSPKPYTIHPETQTCLARERRRNCGTLFVAKVDICGRGPLGSAVLIRRAAQRRHARGQIRRQASTQRAVHRARCALGGPGSLSALAARFPAPARPPRRRWLRQSQHLSLCLALAPGGRVNRGGARTGAEAQPWARH